jgi:hypothetical protein
MMCARCDEPIRKGQRYETHDVDRASGPPVTVTRHAYLCKRVDQPTGPSGRGAWGW